MKAGGRSQRTHDDAAARPNARDLAGQEEIKDIKKEKDIEGWQIGADRLDAAPCPNARDLARGGVGSGAEHDTLRMHRSRWVTPGHAR